MNTKDERRARVRRLTNDVNARVAGFAPAGSTTGVPQYRRRPKAKRAMVTRYEGHLSPRIGVRA